MKKLSLSVLSSIAACTMFANSFYYSEENADNSFTPLSLSIITPLQLPSASWDVYGIALNALYAQHNAMYGLDAGLVSFNKNNFAGIQAQGAVNWCNIDAYGIQVAGLANSVMGNGGALQLSSILNYNRGEFYGAQVSTVNYNGTLYGLQLGGFNYNKGISKAIQFGVVNANVNECRGCSFGALNYASRFRGLQLGVFNEIVENGRGLQLGVFNAASNYTGVQIGLFNIIQNGSLPIMLVMNAQF